MYKNFFNCLQGTGKAAKVLFVALIGILPVSSAFAVEITVNGTGTAPVEGFRWTLEVDNSYDVVPGTKGTSASPSLSLDFHASHAPVIASGTVVGNKLNLDLALANMTPSLDITALPSNRLFLSVLPNNDYDVGGISFDLTKDTNVFITVGPRNVPTAQISVLAFNDNATTNGAPDLPQEQPLAGFDVLLFDAAGIYGQAGGQMIQDAFGNPLGTVYQKHPATGLPSQDADGNWVVDTMGTGVIKTDVNGRALIENLPPGKYGIQIVPPVGSDWIQVSTIEGSKVVDAWVHANEPSYFMEFGPPGHHVFIGFVSPSEINGSQHTAEVLNGGATVTGRVVNLHSARPPKAAFYAGEPVANCMVGLNESILAGGRTLYVAECDGDSNFSIPSVPAGTYQLVVWDKALFKIIALLNVTVDAGVSEVALMDVPVFDWFGRLFNTVFYDGNKNGYPDDGEVGVLEQNINVRWRNGAIYRGMPTDLAGESPMEEVFPFFHWLVAEVDFARFNATGATWVVDDGGPVFDDAGLEGYPSFDMATPQVQADGKYYVTETGPVLTLAFQQFLGQTSFVFWGKAPYDMAAGENGGISGIVFYAPTRAEEKPQFAAAEEWETGIPRVQVSLYQASAADPNVIDDMVDGNAGITYADVDNYPLGNFPGLEDVDHNGNSTFDLGDAVEVTWTDSFDDNLPTDCIGPNGNVGQVYELGGAGTGDWLDCFDGMRTFNQIRPGIFDGGYAFAGHLVDANGVSNGGIMPGNYIVKVDVPPGYELLKEEDKNVDFGMSYTPQLLPAECVGAEHSVPTYLSLNSDGELPLPGVDPADLVETNPIYRFAADGVTPITRRNCDLKAVPLVVGTNAAADFFLFTQAPKAARAVGFVLNDLGNEWDPNAAQFGEKVAPPWIPVTFRDWTGRVVAKTNTDEWGKYNALLPSTFTANLPMPSGMGAQILTVCINDASPVSHPERVGNPQLGPALTTDPNYYQQYSQFCYTLQYMAGTTSYLDTPVVPIAAFAAKHDFPVDCEAVNGAPKIYSAISNTNNGPYVPATGGTLVISSMGNVDVPNPQFDSTNPASPRTIVRDYGFGDVAGQVMIGDQLITVDPANWSNAQITVAIPSGTASGQLTVVRGDNGVATDSAVTVTVGGFDGGNGPAAHNVITVAQIGTMYAAGADYNTIQDAIDAAAPGDMVLIAPGVYEELVIMYKPILLQGSGNGTIINAVKAPNTKLAAWRMKIRSLLNPPPGNVKFDLLPGQPGDTGIDATNNEPGLFASEEGAGITVVGIEPNISGAGNDNRKVSYFNDTTDARIDGIQITGAQQGGGIFVNGNTDALQISNNRLIGNQGTYSGGIRVGDPMLNWLSGAYEQGYNRNINITHNEILKNGGTSGAGGGVSIYSGSTNYKVQNNRICGNMSSGHGGGVGHNGESPNGLIANNQIIFNQSFNQGLQANGGGIAILGKAPLLPTDLTDGTGPVTVDANLIQGNNSGAGDGAGIVISLVDGTRLGEFDTTGPNAADAAEVKAAANRILVTNNMIVNNVAGLAGGGISAQDALNVEVVNNTVANNDSSATASGAFTAGNPNVSAPQPAGVVARANSAQLLGQVPGYLHDEFAFPDMGLLNNILFHNRSFHFELTAATAGTGQSVTVLLQDGYDDLGVIGAGAAAALVPNYSVLTTGAPEAGTGVGNVQETDGAALFASEQVNVGRFSNVAIPELKSTLQAAVAFDEGGNFIDVFYGPLSLDPANLGVDPATGNALVPTDYHLAGGAVAVDAGQNDGAPVTDYDGQTRLGVANTIVDTGADEAL